MMQGLMRSESQSLGICLMMMARERNYDTGSVSVRTMLKM